MASAAFAADVKITGIHNCCGQCNTIIKGTLDGAGATNVVIKPGEVTSFPQAVKLEPNETVVFSWIVYKSRADRDRINELVMKDPRITCQDMKSMPFDGKRMIFGGFETLVDLR